MKSNPVISIIEYRLLIIVAFFAFFLTITNLGSIIYLDYLESLRSNAIEFSSCGIRRANFIPHFRFFALLIFPILIWKKNFVFSSIFAFLSSAFFAKEIHSVILYISENEVKVSILEILSYSLQQIDFMVFLLVSILLVWQILILYRISKTKLL